MDERVYKHYSEDDKDVHTSWNGCQSVQGEFNGCEICANINQWMIKMYELNSMNVKVYNNSSVSYWMLLYSSRSPCFIISN